MAAGHWVVVTCADEKASLPDQIEIVDLYEQAWATNPGGLPGIRQLALLGKNQALKFETADEVEVANGVKLTAKNGQTLNITAARGLNTKFFRLSKTSLAPVDVIFKALREVFPRDNFRLYREIYKGIKKDSYGVEFAEPPRTTAKHVTFPETDNAGKGMWTAPYCCGGVPIFFLHVAGTRRGLRGLPFFNLY